ncbi:MAG: hypothetical protein M1832_001854 [Thelocarpon impressellum]|nr:MAG: hypothetical protein M1832_001854 [Thelocarpon impressellum]
MPEPLIGTHAHPLPSATLCARLVTCLPSSLPLLRRLRFAPSSPSASAHVLATLPPEGYGQAHFAAAYIDEALGSNTQGWVFSCVELPEEEGGHERTGECAAHVASLLRALRSGVSDALASPALEGGRGSLLLGNVHALTLPLFPEGSVEQRYGPWRKYIFSHASLSAASTPSGGEGEHWTFRPVQPHELPLVMARSSISRTEGFLAGLPSMAAALVPATPTSDRRPDNDDGGESEMKSWAFLDPTDSLISLHTEPEYRRRGLARAVAGRLLRDALAAAECDGHGGRYAHADVGPENEASARLCEALGGRKEGGEVWWVRIDVALL